MKGGGLDSVGHLFTQKTTQEKPSVHNSQGVAVVFTHTTFLKSCLVPQT